MQQLGKCQTTNFTFVVFNFKNSLKLQILCFICTKFSDFIHKPSGMSAQHTDLQDVYWFPTKNLLEYLTTSPQRCSSSPERPPLWTHSRFWLLPCRSEPSSLLSSASLGSLSSGVSGSCFRESSSSSSWKTPTLSLWSRGGGVCVSWSMLESAGRTEPPRYQRAVCCRSGGENTQTESECTCLIIKCVETGQILK